MQGWEEPVKATHRTEWMAQHLLTHFLPVKGLRHSAQMCQGLALSGLHTAEQKVADLVPLLSGQVTRAAQVECQLPELHNHPSVPHHTCQRVYQM